MKFITIVSLMLTCFSSFAGQKEVGIGLDYRITMDSAVSYVPKGKCLIELIMVDDMASNLGFGGLEIHMRTSDESRRLEYTLGEKDSVAKFTVDSTKQAFVITDPRMVSKAAKKQIKEQGFSYLGFYDLYTVLIHFKSGHHIKILCHLSMGMPVMADKPIIYLYPETEQEIEVKLQPRGELNFSYPVYDNGWKYTVTPEGIIKSDTRNYYYLFWEGVYTRNLLSGYDDRKGFVVKGKETQAFFEKILPQMGLTPTEYNEFIVYWTPLMQNNKYNFIHFKFNEAYDEEIAGITVNPKPDNMFRVFMVFKPLYGMIDVEAQDIPKVNRDGFTLIEWGGTEYKTPTLKSN